MTSAISQKGSDAGPVARAATEAEPSGAVAGSPHLTPASAPFTRKRIGAHYCWADELTLALAFAEANGFALHLSNAAYEVATITGPDFRVLIYPHTTSGTRNQHLRVRDHGSRNKRRAQAVMAVLNRAAGFNCTFSFHWPNNPLAHRWNLDLLSPEKRPAIYAEAGVAEPEASASTVAGTTRSPQPIREDK